MSKLREIRISGVMAQEDSLEIILKIENDNGHVLGTFDITGEGIYYYRRGSQILTDGENASTLDSYDGFMSFENMKDIFEILHENGWDREVDILEVKEKVGSARVRAMPE